MSAGGAKALLLLVLAAAAAEWTRFDASDSRVGYTGRFELVDSGARFDWPCTSIRLQVSAPGATKVLLELDGGGNRFMATTRTKTGEEAETVLMAAKKRANYTIDIPEETVGLSRQQ